MEWGASMIRVGVLASALVAGGSAFALSPPSAEDQETLVRTSLLTFNDANLTGNYAVLHAKAAKPLRDQIPAEKMKQIFKDFADKGIDISKVASKPVKSDEVKIDDEDALILAGTVPLTPTYTVTYRLRFIMSDGEWKLLGINVKT